MSALPYMKFFPTDWIADTRMIPLEVRGAWMDILSDLWNAPIRGIKTADLEEWSLLWGVSDEVAERVLGRLGKVAGIRRDGNTVTIYSRRMIREELERERSRNSKRDASKRDWSIKNQLLREIPDFFPSDSRSCPEEFPPDSRPIPGDSPEARSQKEVITHTRGAATPSVGDCKAYASSAPVPITEECAVAFHDTQSAGGWITKHGHPIADWRAALRRYASVWNENAKAKRPANHRAEKASKEYPEPDLPLPRI